MNHQRPRRIGIHGVRGAGKTCFLGSVYGFRSTPSLKIDVADDASCRYLAGVWKELSEARSPGATMLSLPETLRLDLTQNDETIPLELTDYAGALVQAQDESASPAAQELSGVIREWLRGCQVILLFLDSTQPDMEQLDALDLLLTELRRDAELGADRPLGIVLTKWDSQGTIGDDLSLEQERARVFLQQHHVFQQIFTKLGDDQGHHVRLFPLSSFGNQARGHFPPLLSDYRPCHLHAPLVWAAEVSERVLIEQTRWRAEKHLHRWWPDYQAAEQEWVKLEQEAAPLTEIIQSERRNLQKRRQSYRNRQLVPVAAIAGLLALGGILGSQEAERQARETLAFAESYPMYDKAQERLAREEEFLSTWVSLLVPSSRAEVCRWADADRRAVAEQHERERFLHELSGHEQAKDWSLVREEVADYLTRYPDCPLKESLQWREQQAHLQLARIQALDKGATLERQGRFDEAARVYRRFRTEFPDSPWEDAFVDQETEAFRRETDAAEYNLIRQLVREGTGSSLEEAGRRAIAYLESRHAVRAMRTEVSQLSEWLDGLRRGGQFFVVVDSVAVMPGSALLPTLGVTVPRVHLTINGVTHRTTWLRGSNTTPGERLGPFPFQFGEPGSLLVRVEASRNLTRNPWAKVELTDPRFILAKTNSTVAALCEKGHEVRVGLRCEAALPPDLPTYRRP